MAGSTGKVFNENNDMFSVPHNAVAVTPNDSTDLTTYARALWIGVAGDVAVDFNDSGSNIVLKNVPSGTLLLGMIKRVRATSTTATSIVALW